MARKLSEIRLELKHRMHMAVKAQHTWLSAVLRGHYQYFGVMFNSQSLTAFYKCVKLVVHRIAKAQPKGRHDVGTLRHSAGRLSTPEAARCPSTLAGRYGMRQDIFRKSPLPESGTMGSVGAKASNG